MNNKRKYRNRHELESNIKSTKKCRIYHSLKELDADWSDDDDQDYCDNDATASCSNQSISSRNKLTKRVINNKQLLITAESSNELSPLPVEIWIRIFSYVVSREGSFPFLLRMARVSRLFRKATRAKCVWRNLNLDFVGIDKTSDCLRFLMDKYMHDNVRQLSLNGWNRLTQVQLNSILQKIANSLTSLDISSCTQLIGKDNLDRLLLLITTNAKSLDSLDISYLNSITFKPMQAKSIIDYLTSSGSQHLRHLYLNGNWITQLHNLIESASVWTCRLTLITLDLSKVKDSTIHTVNLYKLAMETPNLQSFRMSADRLDYSATIRPTDTDQSLTVWPSLKQFGLSLSGTTTIFIKFNLRSILYQNSIRGSQYLIDLLKCCNNLSELSFDSISNVGNVVCQLDDINRIRLLRLPHCTIGCATFVGIEDKFVEILNSVEDLDVGWIRDEKFGGMLNNAIGRLDKKGKLKKINVAGSSISNDALCKLLQSNNKLEWMDLSSCRWITRGLKRLHCGVEEMKSLRKSVIGSDE